MIAGIFHQGSGLGDQLFRYITVRTLAEEKGYDWGMVGNFKGDFFKGGFLYPNPTKELLKKWTEKDVRDRNGNDIRSYDPEINFVQDNTIIDGSFEDDKYWRHNLANISKWLAVEPLNVPDDLCVIGFRGGEYAGNPDLFLQPQYWADTINKLVDILGPESEMEFQVHTDDPFSARKMFPELQVEVIENTPISHSKHTNMGFNWRSMRHAKYAIIPNSAFFIMPRILKHYEDPEAITIAPRYWARRNTKIWARPACYYPEFTYL